MYFSFYENLRDLASSLFNTFLLQTKVYFFNEALFQNLLVLFHQLIANVVDNLKIKSSSEQTIVFLSQLGVAIS